MIVTEETARRIADSLERLVKAIEGLSLPQAITPAAQIYQGGPTCLSCGGIGGFHNLGCPQRPLTVR